MADKRKREPNDSGRSSASKDHKRRKGFSVGPANLPDGLHKRKVQKIKEGLIEKAQIKRKYDQMKKRDHTSDHRETIPVPASLALDKADVVLSPQLEDTEPITNEPHPDRQALLDNDGPLDTDGKPNQPGRERQRRQRPAPFKRAHEQGQALQREIAAKRQSRYEAILEAQKKREERDRFRRSMAKARTGGVNGQRKLGRESKPLLERIQRMMSS